MHIMNRKDIISTNYTSDSIIHTFDVMTMMFLCVSVCVCVCVRVHSKRQQAQSINISKHPSKPTSINLNTTIHTLI